MREFKCASLGFDCSWKHRAEEELLADIAALHLRDIHGLQAVGPVMLGMIKKEFSPPAGADQGDGAAGALKEYKCNLGHACAWRYIAMTEELIVDGAAVHARDFHGIAEFTPEMIAHVKRSLREWTSELEKKIA